MEDINIGFIGFGNMAKALADGFINKSINPNKIFASAKNYDKLVNNCQIRGINACKSNSEVIINSDIVILAIKPYLIEKVVKENIDILNNKLVVSLAAGYTYKKYQDISKNIHIICTIPNTPVSINEGVIVSENTNSLNEKELELFKELFNRVGLVEFVDTKQLSIAGTIGGCGPAFGAMFIEALSDAAVKYGLSRESSYRIASSMLAGISKLQLTSNKHPGILKDEVCSPAGTTIKGVSALEEKGFRSAIISAIDAIEK